MPIPLEEYRNAVQRDYEETGYFLDQVVIVKVIEDRLWCFTSDDTPFKLEAFDKKSKREVLLEESVLAKALSEKSGINEDKVALALYYKHVI